MTERETDIGEALLALCRMADRMRAPDHRNTIEAYHAAREEIRDGLRRLYRRVSGAWPDQHAVPGPAPRAKPHVPAAILRHRERVAAGRRTPAKTA